MTDELLPDEAHSKWVCAISRWYHTSKRDWIIANLHEGVPLSRRNSRFLAAILDGNVLPVSGKQGTLTRVKNSVLNNRIHDLRTQGMARPAMLSILKKEGLIKAHVAISALNKRIDRPAKGPIQQRMELDKKLSRLYEEITKM